VDAFAQHRHDAALQHGWGKAYGGRHYDTDVNHTSSPSSFDRLEPAPSGKGRRTR